MPSAAPVPFIKGAPGTLTLSAGNSMTGGQSVSDGTLWLNTTANNMKGPVLVTNGATLRLTTQGCIGAISAGAGDVTLDNGATLQNDDATVGANFLTANRRINVNSGGGTINLSASAGVCSIAASSVGPAPLPRMARANSAPTTRTICSPS